LLFEKDEAMADTVLVSNIVFLDDSHTTPGEAEHLLKEAFDFNPLVETDEEAKRLKKAFIVSEEITQKIPEELFPPCIQLLLQSLKDGKKRALFILINFMTSVGWTHDEIKERLAAWNKVQPEQLRETTIVTHLNYHRQQHKQILPPNCPTRQNNIPVIQQNYYTDLQVCHPDSLCAKIKNPVQYAKKKAWMMNQNLSKKRGKKKDEKKV
jgi:DNA primase large subunit